MKYVTCLHLISASTFENWIKKKMEEFLSSEKSGVIGVHIVKDVPREGSVDDDKLKMLDQHTAGSEHRMGHSLRRFAEANPNIALHPSRRDSKQLKTIIFIDDIMGSGTNMARYINAFHRLGPEAQLSKSIASRYSSKRLRYIALSYATSAFGRRNFKDMLKSLHCNQLYRDLPLLVWERDDSIERGSFNKKMIDLCSYYKSRLSKTNRDHFLGFKRKRGNAERTGLSRTIFEHGCPNNLPAMFWDNSSESWCGLFPGRLVPQSIGEMFTGNLAPTLRYIRPEQLSLSPRERLEVIVRLSILDNLTYRRGHARDLLSLMRATNLPYSICRDEVERCRGFGLIEPEAIRLSALGRQQRDLLRRLSRITEPDSFRGVSPSKFYYRESGPSS